jgi:hypothetical protein
MRTRLHNNTISLIIQFYFIENIVLCSLRPPLGAHNPPGILPISPDRPTTWNLSSGQLFPSFGSPQARDAATLAPRFPRADPSPPLDSWRRHPASSSSHDSALPASPRSTAFAGRHHSSPSAPRSVRPPEPACLRAAPPPLPPRPRHRPHQRFGGRRQGHLGVPGARRLPHIWSPGNPGMCPLPSPPLDRFRLFADWISSKTGWDGWCASHGTCYGAGCSCTSISQRRRGPTTSSPSSVPLFGCKNKKLLPGLCQFASWSGLRRNGDSWRNSWMLICSVGEYRLLCGLRWYALDTAILEFMGIL